MRIACALLALTTVAAPTSAQEAPSIATIKAVEAATTIANGICSNDIVGISVKLPADMQSQDATSLKEDAVRGSSSQGIGPEARYFLWGYQESKASAMLCGAKMSDLNRMLVVAVRAADVQKAGANTLETTIQSLAHSVPGHPGGLRHETIDGHDFVHADAVMTENPSTHEKMDLRFSFYAVEANSYVVLWTFTADSPDQWQRLVTDMAAVRITTSVASAKSKSPAGAESATPREIVATDFQARLSGFMAAWLQARDRSQTLAFIDPSAYDARPFIGTYCDGWYRAGAPHDRVAQTVAANLMSFPAQFARNAPASVMFKASERFPPQWVGSASNDVPADRVLVARLTTDSLGSIFSGLFAQSDYAGFLREEIQRNGPGYWVVFPGVAPDGDIFVIFTLWLKTGDVWSIRHIDGICQ